MAEPSLSIADYAAVIAAIATSLAAVAAWRSANSAKRAINTQRESEKSRLALQKKEVLIQRYHLLLADFAEFRALAYEMQTQERGEQLRLLDKQIRRHCSVIRSLSPTVGKQLEDWSLEKIDGESNATLLTGALGNKNTAIGSQYSNFFEQKAEGLRKIHDEIFIL
ncbi:hypothetical protein [Vreelandella sedimenti]|uniref:hypothetical protein n=1 Tax=Vreelandella sedimenti TaxID=2729618 RepID=UPI00257D2CA6|nr:hypothetical protein [Halomonas sp. UBA3173]|tara:strand:- start:9939 stop:10436 length:498 start_codon:yes stop_codon:yes gene_type:complete